MTTSSTKSRGRLRPRTSPRIVVCGSMSALHVMTAVREELREASVPALVPPADVESPELSCDEIITRKRRASLTHIRLILDPATVGILVVNIDKYGQRDYVGPNALAEIAVAFAHGRRIFLYQGMPQHYAEELTAWGATCLYGDLGEVVRAATATKESQEPSRQLALFT